MRKLEPVCFALLLVGALFTAGAATAESMYSVSDGKTGKMLSWRIDTNHDPANPTAPATLTYSVHEPATDTWRVVTDPTELADLQRRTAKLETQSNETINYFKMTPQERAEKDRDKMIALATQSPARPPPSPIKVFLGIARVGLLLVMLVVSIVAAIMRLTKNRKGQEP